MLEAFLMVSSLTGVVKRKQAEKQEMKWVVLLSEGRSPSRANPATYRNRTAIAQPYCL
jgi:hypothetical protein